MDALNNSRPFRRALALAMTTVVLACLMSAVQAVRAATLTDATKPISLDAASSDFDYRNNLLTFRKVRIAQAGMSV